MGPLLKMPDLQAEILQMLFRSDPMPLTFDEILRRSGLYRLQFWEKALTDLLALKYIDFSYDLLEKRAYYVATPAGRMHLLGLVLNGHSKALPMAETPRTTDSGLSAPGLPSASILEDSCGTVEGHGSRAAANFSLAVASGATESKQPMMPSESGYQVPPAGINLASVSGHSADEETLGKDGASTGEAGAPVFSGDTITNLEKAGAKVSTRAVPTKAVNHEGGTGVVANRKPPMNNDEGGAEQTSPAPTIQQKAADFNAFNKWLADWPTLRRTP